MALLWGRKVRPCGTVVIVNSGAREHFRQKERMAGKTQEPKDQGLLDTPVGQAPSALELSAYERNLTTVATCSLPQEDIKKKKKKKVIFLPALIYERTILTIKN